MKYDVISADGHVDLIWLPPDLFTANASAKFKDRMPYVEQGPDGPRWVSRNGAQFGLVNGMGSAGRKYVPGEIHRSDRMASTGLYEDGKKGVRRLTEPELRLKDQDRDGVQAEILYGVLGSSGHGSTTPKPRCEMLCIYNDWLHDFCKQASRPVDRAGQHSRATTWKSRSAEGGDAQRRQARRTRLRRRQSAGHDRRCGIRFLGTAVEGAPTRPASPCTSTRSAGARPTTSKLPQADVVRRACRPRRSPTSRCT